MATFSEVVSDHESKILSLLTDDRALLDSPVTLVHLWNALSLIRLASGAVGGGGGTGGGGGGLTTLQATDLLARVGSNNATANIAGSQSAQLRALGDLLTSIDRSLTKPTPNFPWLSSESLSITDNTVTSLPNVPAKAVQAFIQYQYSDESVRRVAMSTLNSSAPTQALGSGWVEYNDSIVSINTRAEILAYRVRRLDTLGTLYIRVAYYG